MIRLEDITWEADGRAIVSDVTCEFTPNVLTALVGPNGSGKTTVMHLAAGMRKPSRGHVFLDGEPLAKLPTRQRARRIALVEQRPATGLDLRVRDVVALGRIPHVGAWPGTRDRDAGAVDEAMEAAAVTHLASRRWPTLSGGERQRVHLARALAQRPQVLLLDEPTNHLDLSHQLDFLERVNGLGITVIAVLHDLDLAAAFCQEVAVMYRGLLRDHGAIRDVLTGDLVREVFDVTASVVVDDRMRVNWSRS